jgi:ABC-type glycerol-3-phosphate transport system permease component
MKFGIHSRKITTAVICYFIMAIVLLCYVLPMWFIVSTSFKNDQQSFSVPPLFIFTPTFDNYVNAFTTRGMMVNFTNSLIIGVISSFIAMILGVPAAYALSRYNFKHKEGIFNWFLSTRMAPPILAGIAFYMISKQLSLGRSSLYDTKFLLIIVYVLINLSWVIWMMRSFFSDVPLEIDEAAMVDGCNRPSAFFRTILPLARPGLAATMVFCLIMAWNEYFFALILTSVKSKTLPAALTSFLSVHGLLLGQMCAAGTVVMTPILLFSIFMQKQLVRGLTMGAVKG